MMSMLTTMWTCRWSARRIQRYLDSDPAAPLTMAEIHRLETHLATCERCSAKVEQYQGLRRALMRWTQRRTPDPTVVTRVQDAMEQFMAEDTG